MIFFRVIPYIIVAILAYLIYQSWDKLKAAYDSGKIDPRSPNNVVYKAASNKYGTVEIFDPIFKFADYIISKTEETPEEKASHDSDMSIYANPDRNNVSIEMIAALQDEDMERGRLMVDSNYAPSPVGDLAYWRVGKK